MWLGRGPLDLLALDKKAVGQTIGDLVGTGDDVPLIDPQSLIKTIDTGYATILDERFDDMFEPRCSITVTKDPGQRGWANIGGEVDIVAQQVVADHPLSDGVESVTVEG